MKHILVCIDANFIEPLCVQITSFGEHHRSGNYTYHVIHSDLTEEDKVLIQRHINDNILLHFYTFEFALLNNLFNVSHQTKDRLSRATFYRLMAEQLLPKYIDVILYLDADTIICAPLSPIHQKLDDEIIVGAVIDINIINRSRDVLGVAHDYFNAGMLVISLDEWRKISLTERMLGFLSESPAEQLVFNDQDALNACLNKNQIKLFDKVFNYQTCQLQNDLLTKCVEKQPAVIHFTGVDKPWHLNTSHYYANEYLRFRNKTEFSSQPRLPNIPKVVQEALREIEANSEIVIFGCGEMGRRIYLYIRECGIPLIVLYFLESKRLQEDFMGIPIHTFSGELVKGKTVLVGSHEHQNTMVETVKEFSSYEIINPFSGI